MLFKSQQSGLSWKHTTGKQGSSCLYFISSFTSKNLYYAWFFWTAWMSVCSVDVWGVYVCRENSYRETQCSWITPGQHLLQQSMLGTGHSDGPGNLRKKKKDSRRVGEEEGHQTAETHNIYSPIKHYETLHSTGYTRIRIKTLCVIIFKDRTDRKTEIGQWKCHSIGMHRCGVVSSHGFFYRLSWNEILWSDICRDFLLVLTLQIELQMLVSCHY